MACGIKIVTALVAYLAVTNAVPTQFPRDKTLIYNYYGDVKAGIIEPAAYASQYAISGQFYIKPDNSDPGLPNAFVAVLTDVKTGLHNGIAAHYERTKVLQPIPEPAKVIEDPFLMVYDNNGKLQGVKMPENEPGWSKNMKLAIASMFQLDLPKMKLDLPIKTQAFLSKENTIHGDCWTSYEIHEKNPNSAESNNEFTITKFGSPRNCTNYNVFAFNHVEDEGCELPDEKPVNMASRRVIQAEKHGENVVITSLIAHGGVNHFPWRGRSEAHYVLNNATFVLEGSAKPDFSLPKTVDFTKQPLITDISFQKPESNYAEKAAVDVTQGRHSVDQSRLVTKVWNMLNEAADYLTEDHVDAKEPDFKHGQTMNRLLTTMGFMEVSSFHRVFNDINATNSRSLAIETLFLGMVPYVGTHASSIFIKDIIIEDNDDFLSVVDMLAKLPMNVRNPTKDLLTAMEPMFMKVPKHRLEYSFNTDSTRKVATLSFASLTYRTFKNTPEPNKNDQLNKYLDYFYEQFVNGDDQQKLTALMAMRNIQIGRVFDLLAPIIRGDVALPEDQSTRLRLLAIWAIKKSIPDYQAAHDLLWPVMADYKEPLKLRIAAYDILIRQAPTMANILHLYWFMVYEKNEHLYNYHHTTIKGLANSVDPCDMHLKELTTKIMRFTRIHSPVPYKLSASYMADAVDQVYGHGDRYSVSYTLNEHSGHPEVVSVEHNVIEGRKRNNDWRIEVIMDGVDLSPSEILAMFIRSPRPVTSEDVRRVLLKASTRALKEHTSIDMIISYKGRVVLANHYNTMKIKDEMNILEGIMEKILLFSQQFVYYDVLFEQQVISEIGLPVVMESRIPVVTSIEMRTLSRTISGARHTVDFRVWRHGDYSMSIYNPLLDVWHTIRRSTATDVIFPLDFDLRKNPSRLTSEITYPRLPITKYSKQGMVTHAKDCTTVTEDENDTLKKACPTCSYHEVVSNGPAAKRKHETVHDVKDTGLKYTKAIFDCENGLTPVLIKKDMVRAIFMERKNAWSIALISDFLAYRQHIKNILLSPRMGSCGLLYKQEPSTKYPMSEVKLTLSGAMDDTENEGPLHLLKPSSFSVQVEYKAIDASTKLPARTWEVKFENIMKAGHLENSVNIHAIRKTPNEKNLHICFQATKSYPALPVDILKVGLTKEETNTNVEFSMDETDGTECSTSGTYIMAKIKGALSDEQKKKFTQESISGACAADAQNPLYRTPENLVPRTTNCLDHAIKHTTLRNYKMDIEYKKVPKSIKSSLIAFEDEIKALLMSNIEYTSDHTDEGKMKIGVHLPMKLDNVDLSVVGPNQGYDLIDAKISEHNWLGYERDPPRHEGFGPDPDKHLWLSPIDNTRFPLQFLTSYTHSKLKPCFIYPKIISTLDGGQIPYVVPDDWTLASGEYIRKNFAIFVKKVGDKMGMKIFVGDENIEISPDGSGVSFKINDEVIDSNDVMANGTYVPQEGERGYVFKVTPHGSEIFIQMAGIDVMVIYSSSSIILGVNQGLQGRISGLCGSMDGTQKSKISTAYQLIHV